MLRWLGTLSGILINQLIRSQKPRYILPEHLPLGRAVVMAAVVADQVCGIRRVGQPAGMRERHQPVVSAVEEKDGVRV